MWARSRLPACESPFMPSQDYCKLRHVAFCPAICEARKTVKSEGESGEVGPRGGAGLAESLASLNADEL